MLKNNQQLIDVHDGNHGKLVEIAGPCFFCHKDHSVTVPLAQFVAWQQGVLIQNAMPSVPTSDREFLISGSCPACFERYFNIGQVA